MSYVRLQWISTPTPDPNNPNASGNSPNSHPISIISLSWAMIFTVNHRPRPALSPLSTAPPTNGMTTSCTAYPPSPNSYPRKKSSWVFPSTAMNGKPSPANPTPPLSKAPAVSPPTPESRTCSRNATYPLSKRAPVNTGGVY